MKPIQPRPPEWIHRAPIQASAARDMAAGPEDVFAALADHESWTRWFEALTGVEVIGGERSQGVGTRRRVTVKGLGRLEEEFNVWEPGRRFGFTVVAMSRPALNSLNEMVTLEPSKVGTLVTYHQGFDPKRWVRPLLARAARTRLPGVLVHALEALDADVTRAS